MILSKLGRGAATIAMLVAVTLVSTAHADTLLVEDFDSYSPGDLPTDWELVFTGAGSEHQHVTDSQSYSPPNSFTMLGRYGNSAAVQYELAGPPEVLTFEARMRVDSGATTTSISALALWNRDESTWGTSYCRVRFHDTTITLQDSVLMTYNRNQWYHIVVEYNATARLASVWIDGVPRATDMPMPTGGLGYDGIVLGAEWGAVQSWFDDVKVAYDPPPPAWVSLDNVVGQFQPDCVTAGIPLTFSIRYENGLGSAVKGLRNGFRLYSPDGASWQPMTLDTTNAGWNSLFDGGVFVDGYSVTGSGADTIGLGAVAIFGPGMPNGFSQVVCELGAQVSHADTGLHICVDSTYYPPINGWYWDTSVEQFTPQWDGPHCFQIVPNQPPEITNLPPYIEGDHCMPLTFTFEFSDLENDSSWLEILGGPGTVLPSQGVWTWMPDVSDCGILHTLEVRVCDIHGCSQTYSVDVSCTNEPPNLTTGCGDSLTVVAGDTLYHTLGWDQPDCDPVIFSVIDAQPPPSGDVVIDPMTGQFEFETDPSDTGDFTFTVELHDGADFDYCDFYVHVIPPAPLADYGDAPDSLGGNFPTRYYTTNSRFGQRGVHHLNVGEEVLGYSVSAEVGAEDPLDPDGLPNLVNQDSLDDGVTSLMVWSWGGLFGVNKSVLMAKVRVTVSAGAIDTLRYLNVLFDANGDLKWKNTLDNREWLLINYPIDVAPGHSELFWVDLGLVPDSSLPWVGEHNWLRATLSRSEIPDSGTAVFGGWDGSGSFAYGETEDYNDIPREGPPDFWLKARFEKNPVVLQEGQLRDVDLEWRKGGPDKDTLQLHFSPVWGASIRPGSLGFLKLYVQGDAVWPPATVPAILPTSLNLVQITHDIDGANPLNWLDNCIQTFGIKYNLSAYIPSLGWTFGSQKTCDVVIIHPGPNVHVWWGWFWWFGGGGANFAIWSEDSTRILANVTLGENRQTGGKIAMGQVLDYPPELPEDDREGVLPICWIGNIELDPDFDSTLPVKTDIAALQLLGYTDEMVVEAEILDESTIEVFRLPYVPGVPINAYEEMTYDVGSDVFVDPDNNTVTISDPTNFGIWGLRGQVTPYECEIVGDMNHDGLGPDIVDLVYAVTYMFQGGAPPIVLEEADIDGNGTGPDIADLVHLVTFMFQGGAPPVPCP